MIHGVLPSPKNLLCPLLAAALISAAPAGVYAQVALDSPAAVGRTIVREVQVVFKGAATMDPARVKAQMSTREGEPYTDEAVERDLRSLYATGAVENVDINAVNVAGGVKVVVTISGRGGIGEIGFLGNAAFDNDKLRKEIEVKVGDPVDDAKLSAAQQKILDLYQKKGFSDILVTYEVSPSAKEGFSSVLFKIEEGGRGIIGDIRFEGNNAISDRKLRAKLTSKEKTFWRLWGKAGKLDNQAVIEDVRKIEQAYQDEGYVYVKVGYRREVESENRVALVFEINEGGKYDVAAVAIEGITIFSQEDLTPAIRTESGFPYSGSDVRGDEKMIQDYYGSRGYADARVETRLSDAGPGKLNVTYSVYEGNKSYIRKVNISGNMKTKDEVIRRELPFAPGDELNTVQMETAQTRLENLNYFESKGEANPLTVRPVSTEVDGFKDIEVNVTEKPTGSVNFGAGFSSIDSIVGFIDVTQTNFDISDWGDFRGAGQRFNMNIRYGPRRQDFNLSFTEPWFLGQKLAFTVELFYRNMFYLSQARRYDQTNAGISLGLRKPVGENAYFETTYTLQNVNLDVNDDENPTQLIRNEDGEFIQSKIDFGFVHDTRDSVFITRKGHKFEAGLMASGLGGDVEVYGANIGGQQYFSLPGDTILSIEGMARWVDGWGNSGSANGDVPIFERLFLGGANNLRGYDYREAGPKDASGEPIGGNVSVYASIEYSFPIIEKVRGAVFYDIGYVSTDITAAAGNTTPTSGIRNGGPIVGDGEVYSNVGIGLRMFLPVGPIRLDLGLPLVKDDFTGDSPRFQFNMGYKF